MLIKDFKCPSCGFDLSTYDIPVMSVSEIMTEVAVCPECGKEIEIPKPSTSQGITLGEFTLESKIGSGGMGEVWLAHQISLGRKAAVKILFPSFAQNPDYVARFIQEARLSANLSHPNIVTTFSAGDDRGLKYMASEFIEGEDLEQKIEGSGTIPEKEALGIARCVASALDYAWNRSKLLHRDIKPANIMIDKEGLVKLMDMGISKSLDAVSSMTMTGTMVGTPHYMSIEQAMGKKDLDFRSDEYSLGATLYHMVAGAVPFEAETTMAVLMRHVNDPLPSPKDKNPALSDQCVALIEIMMAKAPENRHKSWKKLIADIDLVLAGKYPGAVPRPSPSATMVGKSIPGGSSSMPRRNAMEAGARPLWKKPLVIACAAVVVLLAAIAIFAIVHNPKKPGVSATAVKTAQAHASSSAKATADMKAVNSNKTPSIASPGTNVGIVNPGKEGLYLIVDISGGAEVKSYPLTYLDVAPADLLTNQKYKTTSIVLRKIPAGTFMMGETGKQHKVILTKDFYIGVFEVTQEQWENVMKTNPSNFKDVGKDAPVESVSWEDCQTFMKELNDKKSSALAFRLPTEAEWEYACRGGQNSKGFEYSGSNALDEVAWFKDNGGLKTHSAGKKKPNELGIYDMSGNVWEWCQDWFGDYPKEAEKDPQGAKSGTVRTLRGGSWYLLASRHPYPSTGRDRDIGFRLALNTAETDGQSASPQDVPPVTSVTSVPLIDDATAEKMIKAAIEDLKKKNPAQKEWKVEFKKISNRLGA